MMEVDAALQYPSLLPHHLFSRSVVPDSLRPMASSTPGFLSFTVSWSLLKLKAIKLVTAAAAAAAAAKSLQSCPTLCDPTDGSPPGSPVPGILQARTLEWGAISFSTMS